MGQFYVLYDDEREKRIKGPLATASNAHVDHDFDVASTPTSVFQTPTDFADSDQLDVYVNQVLQREDVGYTRNSLANEITLSQSVIQSWVRVRIFKFEVVDEYFPVTGSPQTQFVLGTGTVTSTGKIDVYVNGLLEQQGASASYQRNTGNNSIDFNTAVPVGATVLVRTW